MDRVPETPDGLEDLSARCLRSPCLDAAGYAAALGHTEHVGPGVARRHRVVASWLVGSTQLERPRSVRGWSGDRVSLASCGRFLRVAASALGGDPGRLW